jgi:hypothetical protein
VRSLVELLEGWDDLGLRDEACPSSHFISSEASAEGYAVPVDWCASGGGNSALWLTAAPECSHSTGRLSLIIVLTINTRANPRPGTADDTLGSTRGVDRNILDDRAPP